MFDFSDFKVNHRLGFKYLEISETDEEQKTLILLHGMFGGLSNYDMLLKCLHDYNIFVPAIPVFDFNSAELTIHALTKWFRSFCEAMNLKKPVLLGNSMGGHFALDYALHYPDAVSALILTGSSGLMENNLGTTSPRRHDRRYIRQQAARTFHDDDFIDDDVIDEIMQIMTTPSKLKNLLSIARDTHRYNMKSHLKRIPHEVLLVWGENDEITPPPVAHMFLEGLPNARLRWIENCGHAPMMEHPQKFALFLDEFMIQLQNKNSNTIPDYEKNNTHY